MKHKCTYPGHPIVVAVCIMETYKSLHEATNCDDSTNGSPDFITNNDIPGAGGHVYCAMSVILNKDEQRAIELANTCWRTCGYRSETLQAGAQEAMQLLSRFKELKKKW